jgi:hypothetical protein
MVVGLVKKIRRVLERRRSENVFLGMGSKDRPVTS